MENEKLTEEEAIRDTIFIVKDFYDELRKKLKKLPPRTYIPYCSKIMSQNSGDMKKLSQMPPHNLIHSIEANCAYHRNCYTEEVDWNKFRKIVNGYHAFNDTPFLHYTIQEKAERFLLMMERQQIELQQRASGVFLARVWSLFVNNSHMGKLSERFQEVHGFTLEQWFHLLFVSWVGAINENTHRFKSDILLNCEFYKVSQEVANAFYKHISLTVEQVKKSYIELRKNVKPELHFLIRSILINNPIINLGDGTMIAPHPDLIFLYSSHGTIELIKAVDGSEASLAKSFEEYTEKVIGCLDNGVKISTNNQLVRLAKGKSCDFLIETKNEILLVECKATTFTAKTFTENAILKTNSTGKIAKALTQIYTTAYDLGNKTFDSLLIDKAKSKSKRVMGIVVTLGEIPLANFEWYFNSFILPRAKEKESLTTPIYPSEFMLQEPIIMSIETFERMVVVMNNTRLDLMDLYTKKEEEGIAKTGDWNTFLESNLKSEYELLPIVDENKSRFFDSMGVPLPV